MSQHFNFNLYEELEVPKNATAEEIKKSYKKLAMVFNLIEEMASRQE